MAVPKFTAFFRPILEILDDGQIHSRQEVKTKVAEKLNISDEDRTLMLPSGKMTCVSSRVGWAKTYLGKAGLLETPEKGKYRITNAGKEALASGEEIDIKYLYRFDEFKDFHKHKGSDTHAQTSSDDEKTPTEIMDAALNQINTTLSDQLMAEVMKLTSSQFEALVVKLLLAMGYGDGIEDAGRVTQHSNDGGIDGVIKEDKLGFSNVYIQAKQWALDQTVGRPEIQKFVGALSGVQAQKGLFITTAKYSSEARDYVKMLSGTKVVLINGEELMRLMIRHNVGVSVDQIYEVKRIDSDFFEDDL